MTALPTRSSLDRQLRDLAVDGITALRGAFGLDWVDRLHEDVLTAFDGARGRDGGVISRGPQRWYVEVHPEQLRGFVDLITHPWVTQLSRAVLGEDYQVVEIGFDVPFGGAVDQPWHRDFPSPAVTYRHRRLTSLAFNITTVDTTPEMAPFQIALGTQYERGAGWPHRMFPPRRTWGRYERASELRLPQRGDISARSALAVHRGTANRSAVPRPVVILGVDAGGGSHDERHDMTVTRGFWESLGAADRSHLHCRVVEQLEPVVQLHDIEGLVMGAEPV